MRKLNTLRAIFTLALAVASSLAGGARAEEVSFMGWVGLFDFQKAGWENIVKSFEAKNPGVTIRYIGTPNENTLSQATIAINGGNAPDIIQVNPGWVPQLNGMNALAPLDGAIPQATIAQLPEGYRKAMTFNGKLVAIPWIPGPIAMVYNRDLMKEAGLNPDSPPKTWSEFADAVKKICALGDRNGGKVYGVALRSARQPVTALWAVPMIWARGGDVVDGDGRAKFDTPAAKATFEWYKEVIGGGCSPEFFDIQQSRNIFAQGRAGFIFEGPWVGGLVQNLSGGKLKVGRDANVWVANMPTEGGRAVRQLDNSNMLVMSAKAKNKARAAAFMDFIVSDPQAVEFFYQTSSQLTTARLDLLASGKMGQDTYIQAFAAAMKSANPLALRDIQANAIYDAVAPAIQGIVKGAAADAELQRVDRAIERFRD